MQSPWLTSLIQVASSIAKGYNAGDILMINKALAVLALSVFSYTLGVGIIIPLLPIYSESLGATGIWLGIIFGAYSISKSGLITLMLTLREELKDTNITVNSIMPSVIDTPKTRSMPHAVPEKWVKPSEIADLLCHLCSDDCDAVSGSILKVFGKV